MVISGCVRIARPHAPSKRSCGRPPKPKPKLEMLSGTVLWLPPLREMERSELRKNEKKIRRKRKGGR